MCKHLEIVGRIGEQEDGKAFQRNVDLTSKEEECQCEWKRYKQSLCISKLLHELCEKDQAVAAP